MESSCILDRNHRKRCTILSGNATCMYRMSLSEDTDQPAYRHNLNSVRQTLWISKEQNFFVLTWEPDQIGRIPRLIGGFAGRICGSADSVVLWLIIHYSSTDEYFCTANYFNCFKIRELALISSYCRLTFQCHSDHIM